MAARRHVLDGIVGDQRKDIDDFDTSRPESSPVFVPGPTGGGSGSSQGQLTSGRFLFPYKMAHQDIKRCCFYLDPLDGVLVN